MGTTGADCADGVGTSEAPCGREQCGWEMAGDVGSASHNHGRCPKWAVGPGVEIIRHQCPGRRTTQIQKKGPGEEEMLMSVEPLVQDEVQEDGRQVEGVCLSPVLVEKDGARGTHPLERGVSK